jgi:hypothetical protein
MPFFDGCRGRIHHDAWLPDGEVRSVVVLLHGYDMLNEHDPDAVHEAVVQFVDRVSTTHGRGVPLGYATEIEI